METLGQKLKAQNEERARQSKAIQDAKDAEALRKAREAEARVSAFFEETKQYVIDAVTANIPLKNRRLPKGNAFAINWEPANMQLSDYVTPHSFPYSVPVVEFFKWCKENDLVAKFVACHDGMGTDSWFELHIEPKTFLGFNKI